MNAIRPLLFLALLAGSVPALGQDPTPRPGVAQYLRAGAATASVADAYFQAYVAMDWDRLETLLGDEATVRDPTSDKLFGASESVGKATVMANFRKTYARLSNMSFDKSRVIHSGDFALYEGALNWTIDMGDGRHVTTKTPMVVVLEVRNGKVVHHRDYVDYAPFIAAEKASRPARQ